jgi:tetratricopeptide (TPR) repeat protein
MIVRDEEATLPRCLASAVPIADEIVIVDTGSADATVEIARAHQATVLHHDFSPIDFAAARNHGLAHARGDWILVLDADETLDRDSRPIVRALTAQRRDVGYVVNRRNVPAAPGKSPWTDHAVRLFRNNPDFGYAGRVHETVDASILATGAPLQQCDVTLTHRLPAEADARAKSLHYLELLREEASDHPDRLVFLAAEYHKLEMYPEAIAVAERVAELSPDDFTAHFTAALYHHFYAGNADRARGDLIHALRLRPHDPEAQELLEVIERRSGVERSEDPNDHSLTRQGAGPGKRSEQAAPGARGSDGPHPDEPGTSDF